MWRDDSTRINVHISNRIGVFKISFKLKIYFNIKFDQNHFELEEIT